MVNISSYKTREANLTAGKLEVSGARRDGEEKMHLSFVVRGYTDTFLHISLTDQEAAEVMTMLSLLIGKDTVAPKAR